MQRTISCPFFRKAFGWCVPIGALGGLIGLGGGEFRLPVLLHGIGFGAKSAVPLNLIVRLGAGGMVSALQGARMANALSAARQVHVIALLLAAIGGLMLLEVVFPFQ